MQHLRRLTLVVICFLLALSRVPVCAETVTIAAWNLSWFLGGGLTSSDSEQLIHMSTACKEGEVAHGKFGPVGAFGGCLMFES